MTKPLDSLATLPAGMVQSVIAEARLSEMEAIDLIQQEAFSTPWSRKLIRGAIVNPRYQVRSLCDEAGQVLGFYIAHAEKEFSNLDNLAVRQGARGRGLGKALLEDWINLALAEGLTRMTLQVNTANRLARQLYEAYGFQTARLLVSYYPNGEDAFQMERTLHRVPRQND